MLDTYEIRRLEDQAKGSDRTAAAYEALILAIETLKTDSLCTDPDPVAADVFDQEIRRNRDAVAEMREDAAFRRRYITERS